MNTVNVLSWLLEHWPSILSALTGLGALVTSWISKGKIQDVRVVMNGRLDQLLENAKLVAKAEGRAEALREIEQQKG